MLKLPTIKFETLEDAFVTIAANLPSEEHRELLNKLLHDIANDWKAVGELFEKSAGVLVGLTREKCAAEICILCNEMLSAESMEASAIKLEERNGRFVHLVPGKDKFEKYIIGGEMFVARCPAGPIWGLSK